MKSLSVFFLLLVLPVVAVAQASDSICHPRHELQISPIPLVGAGVVAMAANGAERSVPADGGTKSHNRLDDVLQFSPLVATWGLKACGVEGRSDWKRLAVSNALSMGIMAGLSQGLKHTVNEMRPNGSANNSFPSGHTATAFAAATIMHKEYGLTRSPWYSVGAYSAAAATGILRAHNNRHWASDILVGAGIGIISTDLGYLITDLIFKDKGTKTYPHDYDADWRQDPSFFSASLGTSIPLAGIDIDQSLLDAAHSAPVEIGFDKANLLHPTLRLGSATTVSIEGAWFLHRNVGVGAQVSLCEMPVRADGLNIYSVEMLSGGKQSLSMLPGHGMMQTVDNLTSYTATAGVYGSIALNHRFALGAKALAGVRMASSCCLDASEGVNVDGNASIARERLTLKPSTSLACTAGLNLTMLTHNGMACKFFIDYNHTRFSYDATYERETQLAPVLSQSAPPAATATASSRHTLGTVTTGVALQLQLAR
ncbi:phosphatase PAP2 family protein [Sodaliphilus sp.]|uniref:phosphatase PAP2 family protein n=1 Tax=Sodaliphilus sp. TaxID=2815818 RepID=UPI00388E9897